MAFVQVVEVVAGPFADGVLEVFLCVDEFGDLGNGVREFFIYYFAEQAGNGTKLVV